MATISPDDVRTAGEKSKSSLLATELKNGELIIAVTVQTFSHALDEIGADAGLKGKRSAVIAAEAHSSQSGQISSKLKQATVVWREFSKSWTENLPFVLAADSDAVRRHATALDLL